MGRPPTFIVQKSSGGIPMEDMSLVRPGEDARLSTY